jgi:glycosyltransferase involved in cell wall biosynthesis
MLDLATFRGLVPGPVGALPAVVYFHENQLTYPVRREEPRDVHFGLTQMNACLAAKEVWFNSAFHREVFFSAVEELLGQLPSAELGDPVEAIRGRSHVVPPPVSLPARFEATEEEGPIHLLWAARWEHDKNPETFFSALRRLADREIDFRVSVVGERFREVPTIFERSRRWLGDRILHWGFQPSRADYLAIVRGADLFLSTARHEFYGIAAIEAMSAGTLPLMPDRLAYPELLDRMALGAELCASLLYDGSAEALADRIAMAAEAKRSGRPPFSQFGAKMNMRQLKRDIAEAAHRTFSLEKAVALADARCDSLVSPSGGDHGE